MDQVATGRARRRAQVAAGQLVDIWRTVPYGKASRDKLILTVYAGLRTVLMPLLFVAFVLSRPLARRLFRALFHAVPEVRLESPFGNYATRPRSNDMAVLHARFEDKVAAYLARINRGVFVDVGAHIGRHAIPVALASPQVHVIAFEPHPGNFAALERNVRRNGLTNLTALRAACTDRAGPVHLYSEAPPSSGFFSGETIAPAGSDTEPGPGVHAITVDGVRLDDVLGQRGVPYEEVACVKIDVERAEPQVLLGAVRLLDRGRADIIFEALDAEGLARASQILTAHGYRVDDLDGTNRLARKNAAA